MEYLITMLQANLMHFLFQMPHPYPMYTALRNSVQPLEVLQWSPTLTLGEMVGVAVNMHGDPVVLHRGGRVWGEK